MKNSSLVKTNNSHTFITGVDSSNNKDNLVSRSMELITEENLMLKRKIKRLEEISKMPSALDYDREKREKIEMSKRLDVLEKGNDFEKKKLKEEVDRLAIQLEERENDLEMIRNELQKVLANSANQGVLKASAQKQHDSMMREIAELKMADKKAKIKVKQLEEELAAAMKKLASNNFNGVIGVKTGIPGRSQVNRRATTVAPRSTSNNRQAATLPNKTRPAVFTSGPRPNYMKPTTVTRTPVQFRTRSTSPYTKSINTSFNSRRNDTSFNSNASSGRKKTTITRPSFKTATSRGASNTSSKNNSQSPKPRTLTGIQPRSGAYNASKMSNIAVTRDNKFGVGVRNSRDPGAASRYNPPTIGNILSQKAPAQQDTNGSSKGPQQGNASSNAKGSGNELDNRLEKLQNMLKLAKS